MDGSNDEQYQDGQGNVDQNIEIVSPPPQLARSESEGASNSMQLMPFGGPSGPTNHRNQHRELQLHHAYDDEVENSGRGATSSHHQFDSVGPTFPPSFSRLYTSTVEKQQMRANAFVNSGSACSSSAVSEECSRNDQYLSMSVNRCTIGSSREPEVITIESSTDSEDEGREMVYREELSREVIGVRTTPGSNYQNLQYAERTHAHCPHHEMQPPTFSIPLNYQGQGQLEQQLFYGPHQMYHETTNAPQQYFGNPAMSQLVRYTPTQFPYPAQAAGWSNSHLLPLPGSYQHGGLPVDTNLHSGFGSSPSNRSSNILPRGISTESQLQQQFMEAQYQLNQQYVHRNNLVSDTNAIAPFTHPESFMGPADHYLPSQPFYPPMAPATVTGTALTRSAGNAPTNHTNVSIREDRPHKRLRKLEPVYYHLQPPPRIPHTPLPSSSDSGYPQFSSQGSSGMEQQRHELHSLLLQQERSFAPARFNMADEAAGTHSRLQYEQQMMMEWQSKEEATKRWLETYIEGRSFVKYIRLTEENTPPHMRDLCRFRKFQRRDYDEEDDDENKIN